MSTPSSQSAAGIIQFLQRSGAHYRAFDLGSQLRKLSREQFAGFDQGQAYPYPYLNHAWLILLLWNPDQHEQHSIWFMKLPLDEQACLPAAVMSDVLDRLHRSVATPDATERQRLLTDHPYQFTPSEEKMAALHARASRTLGRPPSAYHKPAYRALIDQQQEPVWEQIGLQGIYDVLERRSQADEQALAKALTRLPDVVLHPLLCALEHHQPGVVLTDRIIELCRRNTDSTTHISALRAVSQSPSAGLTEAFVIDTLDRFTENLDVVLAVLSRHTKLLSNTELALVALDRLAVLADADGFNRVVQGLALQPGLSGLVLQALRHPHRSEALAKAIGDLIQASRSVQ
jgi:hypothetical protein